ncbi:hypothetical protein [uncultured Ramlibacter sp.]|uniref:hypothetical protein n=1 Tax=uncultured Ramlibacter sp. TaxID=260755 RepID=UPI002618AF96|nr:hypothetical protein [uncultured Ramlibacter sp.]
MDPKSLPAAQPKPIEQARDKADTVSQDLQLAGAELHLSNAALERHLPPQTKDGDVGRALEQHVRTEAKVQEAAEELAVVTELLEEEIEERVRLEAQLAQARG